jgi:hypothetical protein
MTGRRSPLALLLALSIAVAAACGPAPSASPGVPSQSPAGATAALPSQTAPTSPGASIDPLAIYATIATQVEQIRGLQPKAAITPVLIDEATLRANLTADFDQDNPPSQLAASQAVLTALGLLTPGTSLRAAYLDLESGQVIGYYSPDHDQLFLVSRSGGVGPTQKVTYAHEFTHQLQDQNFDLKKLALDTPDQGDRSLGRLALVEGDAIATQTTWMTTNLTPLELAQVVADASDPAAAAALERAPSILRTTSLFPYTQGYALVGQLMASGGTQAVDTAFAKPPASTEQVLHPEKYLSGEAPIAVAVSKNLAAALGPGWTATAQDTLGELMLRTWLVTGGLPLADATAAAAGWGGDRIQLLTGPGGEAALAIASTWDTPADAAEFAAAARRAIGVVVGVARVDLTSGASRVTIAIAPSADLVTKLESALER